MRYDQVKQHLYSKQDNKEVLNMRNHQDTDGNQLDRQAPKDNDVYQQWHVVYADEV